MRFPVSIYLLTEILNGKLYLSPREIFPGVSRRSLGSVRGGVQGDLICKVSVETPINLTSRQKELLMEFDSTLHNGGKHSPQAKSWLDNVKAFFDDMKI